MYSQQLLPSHASKRLVERLMAFYETYSTEAVEGLDKLNVYTQDIEFKDPIHTIRGSLALNHYLKKIGANLLDYKITYSDSLISNDCAYLSWEMDFAHKHLRNGQIIKVQGMSYLKFTDKVFYHEDSYDLGALIYENIPIIGGIVRYLKNRVAG